MLESHLPHLQRRRGERRIVRRPTLAGIDGDVSESLLERLDALPVTGSLLVPPRLAEHGDRVEVVEERILGDPGIPELLFEPHHRREGSG